MITLRNPSDPRLCGPYEPDEILVFETIHPCAVFGKPHCSILDLVVIGNIANAIFAADGKDLCSRETACAVSSGGLDLHVKPLVSFIYDVGAKCCSTLAVAGGYLTVIWRASAG